MIYPGIGGGGGELLVACKKAIRPSGAGKTFPMLRPPRWPLWSLLLECSTGSNILLLSILSIGFVYNVIKAFTQKKGNNKENGEDQLQPKPCSRMPTFH